VQRKFIPSKIDGFTGVRLDHIPTTLSDRLLELNNSLSNTVPYDPPPPDQAT
jgi:hypothetical protein